MESPVVVGEWKTWADLFFLVAYWTYKELLKVV
jgi:hypothetical protein